MWAHGCNRCTALVCGGVRVGRRLLTCHLAAPVPTVSCPLGSRCRCFRSPLLPSPQCLPSGLPSVGDRSQSSQRPCRPCLQCRTHAVTLGLENPSPTPPCYSAQAAVAKSHRPGLRPQILISHSFWRLQFRDQGVSGLVSPEGSLLGL